MSSDNRSQVPQPYCILPKAEVGELENNWDTFAHNDTSQCSGSEVVARFPNPNATLEQFDAIDH